MDAMLALLWHLDYEARQLVWARANNIPWRILVGRSAEKMLPAIRVGGHKGHAGQGAHHD